MIHTLHKYLPKEQVSNEAVASINALTTTKDLPADPKEGQSYHVNGVDWVFVKGEWVTRQGIYGNEDFGDAHEPLYDGTGEPPSIDTQRSESKETRELSDEPAVTSAADQNDKSGEEVVTENASTDATTTVAPETEPASTPEATPQTEASTETPSEEPSSEPESTEEVPEKTEHENIEERENEAADKPDASEEAEDDTPANESIVEQAPLAHPVEEIIAPVLEVEETSEPLAHDGVQEVSAHIQQLSHAQQALESYYDMIKSSSRISKQEAAILHVNLTAIDKMFNLKTKATGLESYGVTPRDAMEKATVSVESVTDRMKQIGGAIYKKLIEYFKIVLEYLRTYDLNRERLHDELQSVTDSISRSPANAEQTVKQIQLSRPGYFYVSGKFVGLEVDTEKAAMNLAVSGAMAFQAAVTQLSSAYKNAEASPEGVSKFKEDIAAIKAVEDVKTLDVTNGEKMIRNNYRVTFEAGEIGNVSPVVKALDIQEIREALPSLVRFLGTDGKTTRITRIIEAANEKSKEVIQGSRKAGGDERYVQELQQEYVQAIKEFTKELNLHEISFTITNSIRAKVMYLKKCLESIKVVGAGMESFDPFVFSNEGIFTELGNFFNTMLHGKKSEINMHYVDKAVAEIKKTYANPTWLKNRRFVEGEVKFKGDPSLQKNFKSEIAKITGNLKQGQRGNSTVYTRATKAIEPWTSYLINQEYKKDPSKLEKLSTTVPKFDPNKFKPVQYSVGSELNYEELTREALTEAEIASAANEIIEAAQFVQTFWKGLLGETFWSTFNVEEDGGVYGRFIPARMEGSNRYPDVIQNIANNLTGDDQAKAIRMANAINNYCVAAEMSLSKGVTMGQYDFYYGYVRGLMNWIDASTR